MKVLVAGSEGLLMQATISNLLEAGHSVRGVDNNSRHGLVKREREYEFLEGNLCYYDFVNTLFDDIDLVIQGAGAALGVLAMQQRPADLLYNDMVLHANILRSAVDHGVEKLAYVSSSMVYERCDNNPTTEDDLNDSTPAPLTELGLSKLAGERLCQAFFSQYGLNYTIWRPFNILSPGERAAAETGVAHVYADFIQKIIIDKQNPVDILGDGQQIRCFIWVEDIAEAIAKFSHQESTNSGVYNLGNPEPVTIRELAQKIHEKGVALGIRDGDRALEFVHHPSPKRDVRTLIPSIERAKRELGWQPKVFLDQGLQFCIDEVLQSAAAPNRGEPAGKIPSNYV